MTGVPGGYGAPPAAPGEVPVEIPSADTASAEPASADGAPAWRVIAASVAGGGHQRAGASCQDAHAWCVTPGGALVGAVADGAGSAPHARAGATTAARAAVAAARAAVVAAPPADDAEWRTLLTGSLDAARQAVQGEAAALGAPVHDLATTLILVVATRDEVAAIQVGDGATVVRDESGDLHELTTPNVGEYINETVFVSAPDALDLARVERWRGVATHVAALTDGLQMLALVMPAGTPHAPFFQPVFRFASAARDARGAAAQLEEFLAGPRVAARTDDDVTLLLAVRGVESRADRARSAPAD